MALTIRLDAEEIILSFSPLVPAACPDDQGGTAPED